MGVLTLIRDINERDNNGTDNSLPSSIANTVPYCAQGCLSSYIDTQFQCTSTDLACLCSRYSTTGYTLGEFAYGCLVVSCTNPSDETKKTLYDDLCDNQQSIVSPTHSALSLPPLPTATSSASSGATSTSSSASVSVATTSALPTTLPPANQSTLTPSNGTTSTKSTDLTSAQATGISIAAMGSLIVAGLIIFLILYIRKRRSLRHAKPAEHAYDRKDENPPQHYPFNTRGLVDGYVRPKVERPSKGKNADTGNDRRATRTVRPVASKQSRSSGESTRTISQLLPDKPVPGPPKDSQRGQVAASPATVFDGGPLSPRLQKPADAVLADSAPVRNFRQQPGLSLDIPRVAARSPSTKPTGLLPPVDLKAPRNRSAQSSQHSDYIPSYYTSADTGSAEPTTPIEEEQQTRRVAPAGIRIPRPACPEQAVRSSRSSDTSFESTDPDEPTPPVEKQLTPVAESPVRYPKVPRPSNQAVPRSIDPARTPEKQFIRPAQQHRYYATPTNKPAQAARSPHPGYADSAYATKTPSPNPTVDAWRTPQRHGSPAGEAKHMMSGALGLPSNPKDVRGPSQSRNMALRSPSDSEVKGQEVTARSQFREPKLTPTRRGDDLFISVTMA